MGHATEQTRQKCNHDASEPDGTARNDYRRNISPQPCPLLVQHISEPIVIASGKRHELDNPTARQQTACGMPCLMACYARSHQIPICVAKPSNAVPPDLRSHPLQRHSKHTRQGKQLRELPQCPTECRGNI